MKSEITYAELCRLVAEIGEYSYTADIENINLIEAGFESLKVMLISSELKRRGINVRVSELLKKPYAERARIAQENPEAYAAAMNS